MTNLAARASQRSIILLIVTALALTLVADVVAAAARSGSAGKSSPAGQHSGRRTDPRAAYVTGVRKAAADVYAAVGPVQVVLDATIEAQVTTVLPAGDALSHNDAAPGLADAAATLRSLHPAPDQATSRQALLAAVARLRSAMKNLRGLRSDSVTALFRDISGSYDTKVENAEQAWDKALRTVFGTVDEKSPRAFEVASYPGLRASRVSWIYGADRIFMKDVPQLVKIAGLRHQSVSLSREEDIDGIWVKILSTTHRSLVRLHRPGGADQLPFSLRQRLVVLSTNAKTFVRLREAYRNRNVSAVRAAAARLAQIETALHGLAVTLRSYGAVEAGRVVDLWAGHRVAASGKQKTVTT